MASGALSFTIWASSMQTCQQYCREALQCERPTLDAHVGGGADDLVVAYLQVGRENAGEVKWFTGSASGSDPSRVGCLLKEASTRALHPQRAHSNHSQLLQRTLFLIDQLSLNLQVRLLPKTMEMFIATLALAMTSYRGVLGYRSWRIIVDCEKLECCRSFLQACSLFFFSYLVHSYNDQTRITKTIGQCCQKPCHYETVCTCSCSIQLGGPIGFCQFIHRGGSGHTRDC